MKKHKLLSTIIIVAFSMLTLNAKETNVIILLIDDAGYADFGFMGCQDLQTPNIDQLANEGVVFTDAHVSATVCGPSRAGLITGRYQQRFGYECNPSKQGGVALDQQMIAQVMKEGGYKTAAFGKWHLGSGKGYKPNDRGFDYFYGFLSGARPYFHTKGIDTPGNVHCIRENDTQVNFKGYLTDVLADKAVDFIDRNKESPFFIYWSPNAVHSPMEAREDDLQRFEGETRQTLAAMTWALDRSVGKIIEKLKAEGLYENTLIFFLSDNGGAYYNQSSNKPLKGFKGNQYEGGQRVPFVLTYPEKFNHSVCNELTSSLDIFATCASLANTDPKTLTTDGVDLLPLIGKKMKSPHKDLYWRKDKMASARVDDYKLIRVEGLGYKLYNLKDDLGEVRDLSSEEEKIKNKMISDLENWEKDKMAPLWTEGNQWDTITYLIYEDYFNNEIPDVVDKKTLKEFKKKHK